MDVQVTDEGEREFLTRNSLNAFLLCSDAANWPQDTFHLSLILLKNLDPGLFGCFLRATYCTCYYLAPGRGCEVLFSPCLSVCVSVCVCISACPANILVFYFSASRRDIDLKFIQDNYKVVLNSLKKTWPPYIKVKVTGTVHCFLKVQSYHKNWAIENVQYDFVYTYLHALSNETIKTGASREMTSQKIRQYLTFNM